MTRSQSMPSTCGPTTIDDHRLMNVMNGRRGQSDELFGPYRVISKVDFLLESSLLEPINELMCSPVRKALTTVNDRSILHR
jgi:hypothetical protein